eukprot:16610-Heterococcus_DN1.PRE.2
MLYVLLYTGRLPGGNDARIVVVNNAVQDQASGAFFYESPEYQVVITEQRCQDFVAGEVKPKILQSTL